MGRTVEEGKIVLVNGPASVVLVEGRVTVLGTTISEGDKIVVRKGCTLTFEAEEESILDIFLGLKADVQEMQKSSIPESWQKAFDEVLARSKPLTVLIVGGIDRGKTKLCAYMANRALAHDIITAVIDADIGQTNIGPPATISYGIITKQVTDLFNIEPAAIHFIGQTSPTNATERIVHELTPITDQILEADVPFTVINTDGWIEGSTAQEFKMMLLRKLRPDIVIGIQIRGEVEHILHLAEEMGCTVIRVTALRRVYERDRDTRRELREQGYMKYLKNAVLRSIPLNWVHFEDSFIDTSAKQDADRIDIFQEKLQVRIFYYDEKKPELILVIDNERIPDRSKIKSLEEELGKTIRLIKKGEEKGLLVGLLDQNRHFLSLGVTHRIDFRKRIIKLFTPYKETINVIQLGRVKVDKYGREFGATKLS